jgi:predicted RNase H-like HicB family nuclease
MRYTVVVERESDGGYVAVVPVPPGRVSQGETRDEALRNVRKAADLLH